MTAHTDKQFDDDLINLKDSILKMGGIVESMVQQAMSSLVRRDIFLADTVKKTDRQVNQLEMDIDETCINLLALHQPAASDLRFITVGLRISKDLERMGDLAVNIAEKSRKISEAGDLQADPMVLEVAPKVQAMVKNSLDAFVTKDVDKATIVLTADDEIDDATKMIQDKLVSDMQKYAPVIPSILQLILISRHLERLADHATNIAEEVIYLVKGKDVRHFGKKQIVA